MRARSFPALLSVLLLSLLLGACAGRTPLPVVRAPTPVAAVAPGYAFTASFDCKERSTIVQDAICQDEALSRRDRELENQFLDRFRDEPLAARSLLVGFHRHWQKQRALVCGLPGERAADFVPTVLARECLTREYQRQQAALAAWPTPAAGAAVAAQPLADYLQFRVREEREPAVCAAFAQSANESLLRSGKLMPGVLADGVLIAGSHGTNGTYVGTLGGQRIEVPHYDAGVYAVNEKRALNLLLDGRELIDKGSLARWIGKLPNAGGRFNTLASSQTGDYAAIDVFSRDGRSMVLVVEPWGYFSPAARGEGTFAGLYQLIDGSLRPLCLFQTYVTPPVANMMASLPNTAALIDLLERMSGGPSALLSAGERVADKAYHEQALWTFLNMPLLGLHDLTRAGRLSGLRKRHDGMLDAIFRWSERNVASKRLYRQLVPRFAPAFAELKGHFVASHGLRDADAESAAGLILMEVTAYAAEQLQHDEGTHVPLAKGAVSSPRYRIDLQPGDLERGRKLGSLHSAILNRVAAEAIADFIRFEFAATDRPRGRASSGDSSLAAAVSSPELLKQLLAAGAEVNEANAWGKTALHDAVAENNMDSVRVLLAAGAKADLPTREWHSAEAGGPDIEASIVSGRTALMVAAAQGNAEMLQLLVDSGAQVTQRDARYRNACSELDGNAALAPAELARFRSLLCKPDPVVPQPGLRSLGELLAKGGSALPASVVKALVTGTTTKGEADGARYELRFGPNGRLDGVTKSAKNGSLPLTGHWVVDDGGSLCVHSTVVIESMGKRIPLPAKCSRFYRVGTALYSAPAEAGADTPVQALPTGPSP